MIFLIQKNDQLDYDKMVIACKQHGVKHYVQEFDNRSFLPNIRQYIEDYNDQIVPYGSIEFVKACQNCYDPETDFYELLALGFGNGCCSQYYPTIPKHFLLNGDYVLISWKEFKRSSMWFFDRFQTNKLFIRPDSGGKTFTGQIIEKHDTETVFNTVDCTSSVNEQTMILISSAKCLGDIEHRFVIVDGKISAYSAYSWDEYSYGNAILESVDKESNDFKRLITFVANAATIIKHDIAYVMDIGMVDNEPKIIELNSFCCAGLYNCDRIAIVNDIINTVKKRNEEFSE